MEMTDIVPEFSATSNEELTLEEYLKTMFKNYPQGISRLTLMEASPVKGVSDHAISSDTYSEPEYDRSPEDTFPTSTTRQKNLVKLMRK